MKAIIIVVRSMYILINNAVESIPKLIVYSMHGMYFSLFCNNCSDILYRYIINIMYDIIFNNIPGITENLLSDSIDIM